MMRITGVVACVWVCLVAGVAQAQVTISSGIGWSGGYDIGSSSAELRSNAPGSVTPPFTLFNVDSRISPSPGGEVRLGVAFSRDLAVEGGVLFARRRLAFKITGDAETPSPQLDGETLHHYVFDAGLLWQLPVLRRRSLRTFGGAGAGYLRQLHQDRTLVETGEIYYVLGGARYWLRGLPTSARSLGLRGDVRLNLRRNGIDFDDRMRLYPTVSVLMFLVL
jgi:hypothetical protein